MEYQVISNTSEKATLVIEDDMTVGEVRTIVGLMIGAPENFEMTMTYCGRQLVNDKDTWSDAIASVAPLAVRKLYCNVTSNLKRGEVSAEALRELLPTKERSEDEGRQERARARAMEPLVDAMVRNPDTMAQLLQSQPGMQKLMKKNPEVARQLTDPETMKNMILGQMDPDRRKAMNRDTDLAMSRIFDYPGGAQLFERYMTSFMDDIESAAERPVAAGMRDTDENLGRPDPSKERNTTAIPNPWRQEQQQRPGMMNPFAMPQQGGAPGMFGGGNPMFGFPPGSAGATTGGAAGSMPAPDSEMMRRMMNMFMASQGSPQVAEAPAATAAAPPPLAETTADYSEQLSILRDMGFEDEALCLEALRATNGDVEAAVGYIAEKSG